MGTEKEYQRGGKRYTSMELSAMVLERIKHNAEHVLKEPIEEAIITVPAYFNDKQRSDTKKAAQIAGIHVERLINEPSAAALAYRINDSEIKLTNEKNKSNIYWEKIRNEILYIWQKRKSSYFIIARHLLSLEEKF